MSTIIKHGAHVSNAISFLKTFGLASNTDNYLYLATGKAAAWGDEENPDVPVDTIEEETNFWTNVIGAKRVEPTNSVPVIPRIDWTTSTTYVTIDPTNSNTYNSSFYVMNSEYRVYQCTIAGGGTSTQEPLLASEDGNGLIAAGDGYSWQYLYELAQSTIDNLLSTAWLPINWGDSIDLGDTKRDDLAVSTLGSKYVLIQVLLLDTDTDVGAPGTSYRQTAIIANPLDNLSANLIAATAPAAGMTANSGIMMHLENKFAITRAVDQNEVSQTILQF